MKMDDKIEPLSIHDALMVEKDYLHNLGIVISPVKAYKDFAAYYNYRMKKKNPKKISWKRLNRHQKVWAIFRVLIRS